VYLDAAPVLPFTRFPASSADFSLGTPVGTSLPSLFLRAAGRIDSLEDINFGQVVVQCDDEGMARSVAAYVNQQVSLNVGSGNFKTVILANTMNDMQTAGTILTFFFQFTELIALVVCFFALMSSTATNVFEQAKEIGILRAMGMAKWPIQRAFMWETLTVILTACVMGLVVGTFVAYTMLLQQGLFTQLPLPFSFPTYNVVVMVVLSLIFCFGATTGPVTRLLATPSISQIIRRG
jgi:ABC-type antimicrobial peptide transport system permease subunit